MKNKKIKLNEQKKIKINEGKILVIASIALVVFIILSASFFMVFFDRSFYDKEFKKNGVYTELGIDGVRNTADYLIKYLISETTVISKVSQLSIFTAQEKSHLQDVRNLIRGLKHLSILAILLLAGSIYYLSRLKKFKENIKRILIFSGISTLAVLAIIFVLSLNFPAFFENFHRILFPQGNYSFLAQDLLIKMFPENFFNEFAQKMFFHILIISLIILTLGSSSAFTVRNTRRH